MFPICILRTVFPVHQVGLIWTYWAPLGFVLAITLIREAYDDFQRMLRDREINGALYCKHTPTGIVIVKSANIKVIIESWFSSGFAICKSFSRTNSFVLRLRRIFAVLLTDLHIVVY